LAQDLAFGDGDHDGDGEGDGIGDCNGNDEDEGNFDGDVKGKPLKSKIYTWKNWLVLILAHSHFKL
jgi:hypothetical protein